MSAQSRTYEPYPLNAPLRVTNPILQLLVMIFLQPKILYQRWLAGHAYRVQTKVDRRCRSLVRQGSVWHREFRGVNFSGGKLPGVVFRNSSFIGCDMTRLSALGARFYKCKFVGCDLSKSKLNASAWVDTKLEGCRLDLVQLRGATCDRLTVDLVNMDWIDLSGSTFRQCSPCF